MATNIDTSRLAGFFKDRFGEDAEILPDEGYDLISKRIPFDESLKLGEKVSEPVMLQDELGWTFAGGATTGTMFALNDANSGLTVEATWTSQEFVTRAKTSWKALRAAQSSEQAFGNAYDKIVRSMKRGAVFAREFSLLYGSAALGKIESQSGSGTTRTFVLGKADTSAGIWWPLKGVILDAYDAESGGSKLNPDAAIVVTSIDLDANGKVQLLVSGDATDLDACVAGSYLLPKGAEANMMTGIDAVSTNTGTYAGISATDYPFWKSTSLNASSAQATFSKFLTALKVNRLKSGPGKRVALISEATAQDIGDNAAALQRTMKGGGKLDLGSDTITYHSLGGHMIEFLPHVLCKEGAAYLLDFDEMSRIGSTDLTFDPTGKGEYFEHVSGYAGLELVAYWDQGLRVANPASITKITSIVNTY
jgi:hypothetical protein